MGCIHPFKYYRDITSICGAVDGTWQTVDLSDYVPPQAKCVLLHVKNTAYKAGTYYFNVCPTGSGYNDLPSAGPRIYPLQQKFIIVKLNTNKQFDIRRSDADIFVHLTGWGDGAIHFLDTRIDTSPIADDTWEEVDLSALIPANATGAYFYFVNSSTSKNCGARENGSTNGVYPLPNNSTKRIACGVDGNRKVELYKTDSSVTIYLIGYFVAPMNFLLNKVQTPLLLANLTWEDLDLTGKFPTNNVDFAFIGMVGSSNMGIAPIGGYTENQFFGAWSQMGLVRVDTSCQIQAISHDQDVSFHYCEGYQETDTSRYQLGIEGDRNDTYSESDIEYGSSVYGIRYLRQCFIHNGLFWVFYTKQDGSDGNFFYRTSSDGITWSDEILIKETAYKYGEVAHIIFDGTKVSIFIKDTPVINYRRGVPNSNGTITWDEDWQVGFSDSPNPQTVGDHSGAVDSSGYPWLLWCYENTGNGVWYMDIRANGSQTNDGTWVNKAGYPANLTHGTDADNYRVGYLVALLNRNMYAILLQGENPPRGRFYTQSGNSWGSVVVISSRNAKTQYNSDILESWSMSAVADSIGNIHFVFLDEDNNIVYCKYDSHLSTWVSTEEVVLKSGVPDLATPQIAIDYSTGCLYVFYMESDNHVYMLKQVNWVWGLSWIDFLDMSDIGVGHDPTTGDDGCISVSRRVIDDNLLVLAMGDDPRNIRHKVCEIDKVSFTWDGTSRTTPWKQSSILDGSTITAVMPISSETEPWVKWSDEDVNRSKAILMDGNYLLTGIFNPAIILLETLLLTGSKTVIRPPSIIRKVYALLPRKIREIVYIKKEISPEVVVSTNAVVPRPRRTEVEVGKEGDS